MQMKYKIIGLIGHARSGKGEFAKIAVEEFGYYHIAFSDAVIEEYGEKYNLTVDQILERKDAIRDRLQAFAQNIRERKPWHWARRVLRRAEWPLSAGQPIVIDGIRFFSDYGILQDAFAKEMTFVRIESFPTDRIRRGMKPEAMADISEQFVNLFPVDKTIQNTEDLETYRRRVRQFLS
jgi:hypothetical protein